MSVGAMSIAHNDMAKTALKPAVASIFGLRKDVRAGTYMASPGECRARRARLSKMHLLAGDNRAGWLYIGDILGNRIRMKEHAHSYPQIVECRAQIHISSFVDHHSCHPCHNHNRPRLVIPTFQTAVPASILSNIKGCKCRSYDVLATLKCDASRYSRLQRRPTLRSVPLKGVHDRARSTCGAVYPVKEHRVIVFLSLGEGVVISRPLQVDESQEMWWETGREDVLDMVSKGTVDIGLLKVVPDDERKNVLPVASILFLEALGQSLRVVGG